MEHFARVGRTCGNDSIDHIHLTYGALEEVAPILLKNSASPSTITGYGFRDDERAGLLRLPRLYVNFDAEARPASGLDTPFTRNIVHSHKNSSDMSNFTQFCSGGIVTYQSVYLWSHKHHQWFYQARDNMQETGPFVNHWVPLKTALMKRGSSAAGRMPNGGDVWR
jgi:hypothetical protein